MSASRRIYSNSEKQEGIHSIPQVISRMAGNTHTEKGSVAKTTPDSFFGSSPELKKPKTLIQQSRADKNKRLAWAKAHTSKEEEMSELLPEEAAAAAAEDIDDQIIRLQQRKARLGSQAYIPKRKRAGKPGTLERWQINKGSRRLENSPSVHKERSYSTPPPLTLPQSPKTGKDEGGGMEAFLKKDDCIVPVDRQLEKDFENMIDDETSSSSEENRVVRRSPVRRGWTKSRSIERPSRGRSTGKGKRHEQRQASRQSQ